MNQSPNKANVTNKISYPDYPKTVISESLNKLKDYLNTLDMGDVKFLTIKRVIRDIEFTATKIC